MKIDYLILVLIVLAVLTLFMPERMSDEEYQLSMSGNPDVVMNLSVAIGSLILFVLFISIVFYYACLYPWFGSRYM